MEYLQATLQHVPYVISSTEKEDKKKGKELKDPLQILEENILKEETFSGDAVKV